VCVCVCVKYLSSSLFCVHPTHTTQVQSLLEEWRPRLAECQLLLVYAPGKLNKRILFVSKDKDVLSRADPRLRYPHFDTNQAGVTFSGVQHMVKTTMRVYPVSADVLTQTFTS
jgi:hypothetical protein